jgi:thiamine-monophosphate kinase
LEGIGDDCAVLRIGGGHDLLVTTDLYLEGVHFRRDWFPPAAVGHCCLTRGLSDIAAMGGMPTAAFLSLALPSDIPQRWVDEFFRGWTALARTFGVPLAGGDLGQSPADRDNKGRVMADVTVLGIVPGCTAVLRSHARPGDGIYLTGKLGGASALIAEYSQGGKPKAKAARPLFWPVPRLQAGSYLRQRGLVSAMIDVSDGLSTDLDHLCERSGCGAAIEASAIPHANGPKGPVETHFALHGGEDYELLFTARTGTRIPSRIAGVPVTRIGHITRERRMVLIQDRKRSVLSPGGWEHFRPAPPVLPSAVQKRATDRQSR